MITIQESGMCFGPFAQESVFNIENSNVFLKLKGIKTVEFVLFLDQNKRSGEKLLPEIWLIEAKTSAPKPDNNVDFSAYITEIVQKFENSLCLFLAIALQRYSNAELSAKFKNINLKELQVKLLFVVKNHKDEWLMPLKDTLQQRLIPLVTSLNLGSNNVVVLNENLARIKGLIA